MNNPKVYKPRCPRCRSGMMKRIQRSLFDKVLNAASLSRLDIPVTVATIVYGTVLLPDLIRLVERCRLFIEPQCTLIERRVFRLNFEVYLKSEKHY